jgi:uncharacterized protein involved in exopolysaccharide biosynthesis
MISAPLAPYLAFVRRHRWTYLAALLAAVVGTAYYLVVTPRRYTASSTTIVPYREVEVDLRMGQGRAFPVQYSFVVNNHLEVARSSAVHEELLAMLRRDAVPLLDAVVRDAARKRGEAAIVLALAGRLRVASRNETGVLRIDATAPTGEGAAQLANMAMDAYAAVQQRVNQRATREWQSYLQQEEARWSAELKDREDKLEHFRQQETVSSLIEETRLLLEQILRLEAESVSVRGERASFAARREERLRQLGALRERVQAELADSSPLLVAELREQIAHDQNWYDYLLASGADSTGAELRELRQRIGEVNRTLAEQSEQLAQRQTLGEEPLVLAGSLLATVRDIEVDVTARDARLQALRQGTAALRERLDRLPALGRVQTGLQREQDLVEDIYRTVHARLLEANVELQRGEGRLQAVNPAQPPRGPSAPIPVLAAISALLLAAIGGTAVGSLMEALDQSLRDAEEAALLAGAPALCRPREAGAGQVGADTAAALTLAHTLRGGGSGWLLWAGGRADPDLAQRVAERLARLGLAAHAQGQAALGQALAPPLHAGIQVVSADLEEFLTVQGARLGEGAAAPTVVLLVARVGRTRRAALYEAASLLRGAGVTVAGVLVL